MARGVADVNGRPGIDGSPLDAAAIPSGHNVLVAGPALTGKRRLMFEVMCGTEDRAGVVVTTKRSAAHMRAEFGNHALLDDWRLRIVDCVSRQRAVGRVRETDEVRYMSSAGDLTGIGIAVSGFLQDFYHDDGVEEARLGLHSLSTMLMYADIRRVYQFVHVITGRVESSDFVGAFTLDTTTGDDEPLDRLTQLFDSVVEVRQADSGPELRVRGGSFGPAAWTPV